MTKAEQLREELYTNDVSFNCRGEDYVVCSFDGQTMSIATAGTLDDQDFDSFEEMLDGWMIDGHPLREVIEEIIFL